MSLVRAELRAYQDAQMAAERLVEEALKNRCDDNVTVTVVPLFPPRTEQRSKQNAALACRASPASSISTLRRASCASSEVSSDKM